MSRSGAGACSALCLFALAVLPRGGMDVDRAPGSNASGHRRLLRHDSSSPAARLHPLTLCKSCAASVPAPPEHELMQGDRDGALLEGHPSSGSN